jgi:hypothetical protein
MKHLLHKGAPSLLLWVTLTSQALQVDSGYLKIQGARRMEEMCRTLKDPLVFEEYFLLEVQGRPGLVTDSDIEAIQDSFVDAYNQNATCEQEGAFRLIEEMEVLHEEVDAFGDNKGDMEGIYTLLRNFTYLIVTRGSCNVCEGTSVQLFQDGNETGDVADSAICDCAGPRESVFLSTINTVFNTSSSEGIDDFLQVSPTSFNETCTQTETRDTFNGVFNLSISSDRMELLVGSEVEQELFAQGILESYNQANALNGEICDPLFRVLEDVVELQLDLNPNNRQLSAQRQETSAETRELQGNASAAPSSAPTDDVRVFTDILLAVSGRCLGCPKDSFLFNQVTDFNQLTSGARRIKKDQELDPLLYCLCADGAESRGPTEDEVQAVIDVTFPGGGG